MGKEKYLSKVISLFEKSPVVSFSTIERIVRNQKSKSQYAKQLVRNLLLKGKIIKFAKGYYSAYDDPSLAVFCFKPAYLGLQNALSFHNLWEQETIPIIITSRKIRNGIRKINGTNVLIKRINKKYLFGFNYEKDGKFYLPYSDIEKTLIDLIYFRENIDKEVTALIRKKTNKKNLSLYLKKYPLRIRKKVLKHLQK